MKYLSIYIYICMWFPSSSYICACDVWNEVGIFFSFSCVGVQNISFEWDSLRNIIDIIELIIGHDYREF